MICIESYIPKFLDMLYDEEIAKHLSIVEIRDAFHTNQIESKKQASLAFEAVSGNANKVLYIGSWLGFLTRVLVEKYPSINFYEVDMDTRCKEVSGRFNYTFKNYLGHQSVNIDDFESINDFDTVINLSCEHMTTDWYKRIKPGTQLVMQSNNLVIDDHINNCKSLDDFKSKYPLSEVKHDTTLELNIFNRFTLSGVK
ncbi:uncharacterized protein METZ01_LOCUS131445 [marine metagenome]|uniref:Class I SAM-dependent methyltransferase n=1 Tax=marine metagenome TaxID=408172 RepID=A0A381YPM9_9ZZZZ